MLNTMCPSGQGEDVSFSRWFIFWNSRKKHSGNLVGRTLGMFWLWLGGNVLGKSGKNTGNLVGGVLALIGL
jgi:hypothetical protein